jgi:hypothetical protein
LHGALAALKASHHELLADYLHLDAFTEAEERVIKPADLHELCVADPENTAAAA